MKLKYIHLIFPFLAACALAACMDSDWDTPDLSNPPYGNNAIQEDTTLFVTIQELKQAHASAISNGSFDRIEQDQQLRCTVIGNDIGGNLYKQIIVQDATGAIVVGINGTGLFPFLSVGQQILIDLKDLCVGGYGKQAQIGDEYGGSIGRMSTTKWQQHVKVLPTHDMSQIDTLDFDPNWDMATYAGRLVRLSNVTIEPDAAYPTLAPENYPTKTSNCVNRNINGLSKKGTVLRTSTYADFASMPIPEGPVTIYGLATRYNDTWQILMRAEEDMKTE